jgi:cellulose synthase/poly-beta-1,6-N-acetylglucosamine synthase-like glycosyltransferase
VQLILVFFVAVSWLAYVYFGYPALVAMVGAFFPIRPSRRTVALPSVSVLLAARNEEKDIEWKLAETLAWDYPPEKLEILVASDASDDGTDTIVRSFNGARVKFFRMDRRVGKNAALNFLEPHAQGEMLFFTDANAHIEPGVLRTMVQHFVDPRVGCVTGSTLPSTDRHNAQIGQGAGVYESYETLILKLEGRIGSVLVCDGAIFLIRHALFQPLLPELSDDLEMAVRIRAAGYWTLFEPQAMVLERDTSSAREEFRRRRRMGATGILGMWRLRKELAGFRGFQFISHKFLRWLTLVPMLMIVISTAFMADEPPMAILLIVQAVFYTLAVAALVMDMAGRRAHPVLSVPFYVLLGAVGTIAGVFEGCTGKRYAVWEIAPLSRGHREVV